MTHAYSELADIVSRLRWFNAAILTVTPALGIYGILTFPLCRQTALFSIAFYIFSMLGITAGYHRLYSHRAYAAALPVQLFVLLAGASAVQGSALWWARGHRAHHRYTDTALDPYNSHRGLLYTHIGWMVLKPRASVTPPESVRGTGTEEQRTGPEGQKELGEEGPAEKGPAPRLDGKPGRANDSDLKKDPLVMWQHVNYFPIALLMGYALPMLIAGLGWGDWWGGLYYAGMVRLTLVHHCTFCVNSLAHYLGSTPYDDKLSPRDHMFTAIVTLGEGHHNFHHQFPTDYRNAIQWYQWDPTKWFIWACAQLGLASHLKTFPTNEIAKGALTMQIKALKRVQDALAWPARAEELPVVEWEEFQAEAKTRKLILVGGFIHDCTAFADNHPGGRTVIDASAGRDMTAAFFGGVYSHSHAAHNVSMLPAPSVIYDAAGVLVGGVETTHDAPPTRKVANLRPEDIDVEYSVPPAQRLFITQTLRA